ncbi:MAG: phage baseplate assembly protein V [Desulfovibrionaceae bacterium]
MIAAIRKVTAPLHRRIMLMVGRAVLRAVNDTPAMQELQIEPLAGEVLARVERVQNYGFTSHPHLGAEAACVFCGGNRDHGLVLAVDDRRYRIKGLEQGEVAIYTDEDQAAHGHRIVLRRGGVLEIQGDILNLRAETRVHISGKEVEIHADERLEIDTNGYGEAVNSTGGGYHIDSYREGAAPTSTEHGIQPPEVA